MIQSEMGPNAIYGCARVLGWVAVGAVFTLSDQPAVVPQPHTVEDVGGFGARTPRADKPQETTRGALSTSLRAFGDTEIALGIRHGLRTVRPPGR